MIVRIATLALSLAVLTACDRQKPQEPVRPAPPPAGETGQAGGHADSSPGTGTAGHEPAPAGAGEPGGQHCEAGAARIGMQGAGTGMTEEERETALRECDRFQGQERERCQREVRAHADTTQTRQPPRE